MEQADDQCIQHVLAGERDAFAPIVSRYQTRVYAVALRMTGSTTLAEDLTQETFTRAYRALASFRRGERLLPWLYAIVTNLCLSERRSRSVLLVPLEEAAGLESPSAEEDARARARRATVQRAVLALPAEQRGVIVLRHFEGLSYDEIAHILGVPLSTVKIRLHRGRRALRELLVTEVNDALL